MKGIYRYRLDVDDVILEKYYVGYKYKATTTWYLKKNHNAPMIDLLSIP